MLVTNGTFIKTRYFRLLKLGVAILLIGMILKILHWSGKDLIFIIGFTEMIVVYTLSFSKKPIKKRLDYLKLIWVFTFVIIKAMSFLHYINDDLLIIPTTIMWIAIIDYIKREVEKKNLFK